MTSPAAPILYAEDDENDAFFMRHAFTRARLQRPLVIVPDGQQAIDYLAGAGELADRNQHPLPALVLLDLNLPRQSGFDVLKWIKARPQLAGLPVIIFSSSNHQRDIAQADALGANQYCVKPSDIARRVELVLALQERWLPQDRAPAVAQT